MSRHAEYVAPHVGYEKVGDLDLIHHRMEGGRVEEQWVTLTAVWSCATCGALVNNRPTHDRWHDGADK